MQLPVMADRDIKRLAGSQNTSLSGSTSAAANVPELLPTWTEDPEMNVSESFEAANELRIHFPNYEIPTKVCQSISQNNQIVYSHSCVFHRK